MQELSNQTAPIIVWYIVVWNTSMLKSIDKWKYQAFPFLYALEYVTHLIVYYLLASATKERLKSRRKMPSR